MPAVPVVPALPLVPAVPVVSTQALFVQVWFDPQQAVPHAVPVEQLELQVLPLQTSFPVHAFVQVPQWVASDATQEPLHSSSPEGHLHWLAWQVWPPRQGMPQPPQLSESDAVFRHCVPQAVWPAGQLTAPTRAGRAVAGGAGVAGRGRAGASRGEDAKAKAKERYASCLHSHTNSRGDPS